MKINCLNLGLFESSKTLLSKLLMYHNTMHHSKFCFWDKMLVKTGLFCDYDVHIIVHNIHASYRNGVLYLTNTDERNLIHLLIFNGDEMDLHTILPSNFLPPIGIYNVTADRLIKKKTYLCSVKILEDIIGDCGYETDLPMWGKVCKDCKFNVWNSINQ